MIGEISTSSHVFGDMSTDQGDTTETTGENGVTSASSHRDAMYFEWFVVVIGVIGIAANSLVLCPGGIQRTQETRVDST